MNRKIAALGMAVFAALAFSAVVASAASAANSTHHITASETWIPTVSAINTQEFRATTKDPFPRYSCENVSASVTEHIPTTTDKITVTPSYENCTAFSGEGEGESATAFVENNGCDYTFTSTTTDGNPTPIEEQHASVDITKHVKPNDPPEFCEIEIRVTVFKFPCAAVPSQEVADAVRYKQDGNNIIIEATAHNITNTTVNSIACPTATGEDEVHHDGSYTGDVTVKGSNTDGGEVPLELQEFVTE